ncbi:DNA repair protein XRCC1-like [Oppia nitens]|uniref:DNA repair protein XRCC1-like n=1 Tax=Oppia nitens TaxID=1686743 RepID=UPI0023D9B9CC|nr:DNA repair protein XRCC1-like [Oppia nitens]
MPQISFSRVSEFSSEDVANQLVANNLLNKTKDYRSWKCHNWQQTASIVLDADNDDGSGGGYRVDNIEIGNDCSAFVEVFVANTLTDPKCKFQVLLSTSSFMTPSESKALSSLSATATANDGNNNSSRIRNFPNDKLSPNSRNEKWNRFKIVCTQPFNKTIGYGLSFIRFNTKEITDDDDEEMTAQSSSTLNIGPFRLRSAANDDSDESGSTRGGSLFKNRNNNNSSPNLPTYGSLSTAVGHGLGGQQQSSTTKATPNKPKATTTPSPVTTPKLATTTKPSSMSSHMPSHKTLSTAGNTGVAGSSSSSSTGGPSPPKKQRRIRTDVPFNQLMKKVVIALSGYVNPKRSELRDKAIKMGAKYSPDWSPNCTHLICAFINTPKYNDVKQQSGRIVTEKWIEDCYNQKRLVYWRNYILGKYNGPESDESEPEAEDEPPITNQKQRKRIQYIDDDEEDQVQEVIGFNKNNNNTTNTTSTTNKCDDDLNNNGKPSSAQQSGIDIDMNNDDDIYDMDTDNELTATSGT